MKIKTTSCLYEKNHVHDIFFNNEINNIERNKTSGKVKNYMQTRHHWIRVFDARSIILSCVSSFDFLWKSV